MSPKTCYYPTSFLCCYSYIIFVFFRVLFSFPFFFLRTHSDESFAYAHRLRLPSRLAHTSKHGHVQRRRLLVSTPPPLLQQNLTFSWYSFNDWFTGHLNYQVEHHLFPTMPRHNYSKANVLVKELFKKHGLMIETKPLGRALCDVVGCLKEYSTIWRNAYYHS